MKKKFGVFMAAAMVLLLAVSAFALSDEEYKEMKKDSPEFAKADKELTQAWNEAKKVLSKKDFAALKKEQLDWIADGRDEKAEELIDDGMEPDEAYAAVTRERTKVIRTKVEIARKKASGNDPAKQAKYGDFYAIYERKDGVYFETHGNGSRVRIEFFDGDFTWEGDGTITGQKIALRDGKNGRMTLALSKWKKGLITVITVKGNGKLSRLDGTYNAYEGHM